MPLLSADFISLNIFNKGFAAVFKGSFMAADVPVIKQSAFLGRKITLDSPFLVEEHVFPKMSAAAGIKVIFHLAPLGLLFADS